MNCVPNQIAVIVDGPNRGCWVRTEAISNFASVLFKEPTWDVEALAFVRTRERIEPPGAFGWIEDTRLRPINPAPGSDCEVISIERAEAV